MVNWIQFPILLRIKCEVLTMVYKALPDLQPNYLLDSPPTTLPLIYSAPATWPPCVLKQAPRVPASVPLEPLFPFLRTLIPSFSAHVWPSQRGLLHQCIQNSITLILLYVSSYHLLPLGILDIYLFVCLPELESHSQVGRNFVHFVHCHILCACKVSGTLFNKYLLNE